MKDKKYKEEWLQPNGKYQCPTCFKDFSVLGIVTHIWRAHGEGKNMDPNIGYKLGTREAWNKGKTTPDSVRKKLSKALKGKPGHKMSEESRKKISETRKKLIKEGKIKMWNSSNLNPYSEQYFEKWFFNENLKFKRNFHIWTGNQNYFLDFYCPKFKINVEIDGTQHQWKDRKITNKKRDNYLISQNIKVIRINWRNSNNEKNKTYFKKKIKEIKNYMGD